MKAEAPRKWGWVVETLWSPAGRKALSRHSITVGMMSGSKDRREPGQESCRTVGQFG